MFDTASCEVARKYYKRGIYQWNEKVDSTLLGAKAPKPEAVLLREKDSLEKTDNGSPERRTQAVRKDGHRQFGKTDKKLEVTFWHGRSDVGRNVGVGSPTNKK